ALITGGASGIGRATALLFAKEGARVAIADRDEPRSLETQRLIENTRGHALVVSMDVTNEASIERGIAQAVERFGRLDILFNNAGVLGRQSMLKLHDLTMAEYDRMMDVNFRGVVFVAKHAIRAMLKTDGGAIVNTSSMSGLIGMPGQGIYAASKGAVAALTRQMAIDYAPLKIRVNAVAPGYTQTPMLEAIRPGDAQSLYRVMEQKTPIGRMGRPEDIAQAVLYLVSDASSFVTGTVLVVDGGYTAA
ncbi:MAG: SDR family oxidoreductase, partial [Chloroflexi bacterium]|nr:SDR family oxidoreductase [Chloroflexota bacterium]